MTLWNFYNIASTTPLFSLITVNLKTQDQSKAFQSLLMCERVQVSNFEITKYYLEFGSNGYALKMQYNYNKGTVIPQLYILMTMSTLLYPVQDDQVQERWYRGCNTLCVGKSKAQCA